MSWQHEKNANEISRSILAKQCYVGLVGLQDAGKTTLMHKLWGIGGRTGHFMHTDVPAIYEIHRRVLVVDFPGSNRYGN